MDDNHEMTQKWQDKEELSLKYLLLLFGEPPLLKYLLYCNCGVSKD